MALAGAGLPQKRVTEKMSMLKKYAPHLACVGAGVAVGLFVATTAIGAKAVAKVSALRSKVGV